MLLSNKASWAGRAKYLLVKHLRVHTGAREDAYRWGEGGGCREGGAGHPSNPLALGGTPPPCLPFLLAHPYHSVLFPSSHLPPPGASGMAPTARGCLG